MKVAVIDNNEIYSDLLSKIIEGHSYEPFKVNLHSKMEEILDVLRTEKPSLVFLNGEAHLEISNNSVSQPGVDILKHIRLTEDLDKQIRKVPIILYSYAKEKEELIRSRPENLIVFSEGCYYLNIFNLNRSIVEDLINVVNEFLIGQGIEIKPLSDLNSLRPYIKADTRDIIIEDRHSIANWWGPQRLLLGHILADPEKQSSIAEQNPVMLEFQRAKDTLAIKEFLFLKDNRAVIDKKRRRSIIQEYNSDLPSFLKDQKINALLASRKVLYIDDEASTGWVDAFKQILYPMGSLKPSDKSKDKFSVKQGDMELLVIYKSFDLAERELNQSSLKKFALVMLDLRDKEKDKQTNKPDELTGIRLLKKLRDPKNGDPSIPILMVTASNKLWNYEKVLELGANAYWLKESPEYGIDDEYTLRNYLKLRNELLTLLFFEPSLRKAWSCIADCETELNNRIRFSRSTVKVETKQAYGEIILLLKKGFEMLSGMKSTDLYVLRGITTLLGAAWEKYRGRDNLKQLWKYEEIGNRANIVDLFLVTLRCWFVHGKAKANEIAIDDIVNMYIWFKNLIMQQKKYMELNGINRERKFPRYYVEVGGKKYFRNRDDNEDLISTYKSFWTFLEATMSAADLLNDDCQRIKKRFTPVI